MVTPVAKRLRLAIQALVLAACFSQAAASQRSAEPISAHALATLRDLDALSVSPDSRWAVFQVRQANPETNHYDIDWYLLSLQTGDVRRVGSAGEPQMSTQSGRLTGYVSSPSPVWSPDSAWFAYSRREGGRVQIWRSRTNARRPEQLTHNEGDVSSLVITEDGRRLLYETQSSQEQVADLLAAEARSGFLFDERFHPSFAPGPINLQNVPRELWAYDLPARRERPASASERVEFGVLRDGPAPNGRPGYRADWTGGSIATNHGAAWTEAQDPARQGVYAPLTIVAQRPGDSEPLTCRSQLCTSQFVDGLWWLGSDRLVFLLREGRTFRERSLYSWRVGQDGDPDLVLRTLDLIEDCQASSDRLICFYEKPSRPRRLVEVDTRAGSIHTLFDPNPEFENYDIAPARVVEFSSRLAGDNHGYLVLPPRHVDGTRLPVVVITYRCRGFLRGGTGDEYPMFALAAQSFAVLCFNTPDTDFAMQATLSAADYQARMRGPGDLQKQRVQEGLRAALETLIASGVADRDRIGVTGLSFGSETVMYALFNRPQFAAAVASGPEFGPAFNFLYGVGSRDATLRQWRLAQPAEDDRWDALSVTRNTEAVRAPLLFNVADHELLLTLPAYTALRDAGRGVEMYVFPDEYHVKWQPAHRLAIYNRNIDWMNFWLRGVESGLSGDASQYTRWRAMRENQCRLFGQGGSEYRADAVPWYCRPGALEQAVQ